MIPLRRRIPVHVLAAAMAIGVAVVLLHALEQG